MFVNQMRLSEIAENVGKQCEWMNERKEWTCVCR